MKKISKKREEEVEKRLKEDGDEGKWDKKELGNDPKHTKISREYSKSSSVGTSIRMPLKLIRDLKKLSEKEGIPYQTLVKLILTRYVRDAGKV